MQEIEINFIKDSLVPTRSRSIAFNKGEKKFIVSTDSVLPKTHRLHMTKEFIGGILRGNYLKSEDWNQEKESAGASSMYFEFEKKLENDITVTVKVY